MATVDKLDNDSIGHSSSLELVVKEHNRNPDPLFTRADTRRKFIQMTLYGLMGAGGIGAGFASKIYSEAEKENQAYINEMNERAQSGQRILTLPGGKETIITMGNPHLELPTGAKPVIVTETMQVHCIPNVRRKSEEENQEDDVEIVFLVQEQTPSGSRKFLIRDDDSMDYSAPAPGSSIDDQLVTTTCSTKNLQQEENIAKALRDLQLPDASSDADSGIGSWFRSVVLPRLLAETDGTLEQHETKDGFRMSRLPSQEIIFEHPDHSMQIFLRPDGTVLMQSAQKGRAEVIPYEHLRYLGGVDPRAWELMKHLVQIQLECPDDAKSLAASVEQKYFDIPIPLERVPSFRTLRSITIFVRDINNAAFVYYFTQLSVPLELDNKTGRMVGGPTESAFVASIEPNGDVEYCGSCGYIGTITPRNVIPGLPPDKNPEAKEILANDPVILNFLGRLTMFNEHDTMHLPMVYSDGSEVISNHKGDADIERYAELECYSRAMLSNMLLLMYCIHPDIDDKYRTLLVYHKYLRAQLDRFRFP